MKILYTRTQFWFNLKSGGSVGHTLGVINGFKQNGCKIKIISNEKFLGIESFDYSIIKPKINKSFFLAEFLYNFYARNRFKKEILKFNPDFIYHRYTGHTFFVTKTAEELNIPLILEFNSFDTWKMKYWGNSKKSFKSFMKKYILYNYISYNIVKHIENYNLKNASLIVVVSQALKNDLLKLGIPEKKVLVNPNGVDTIKFNPEIAKSKKCKKLRQKLGVNENEILIGFSGTFGLWHGIPQLTEAIDKILREKLSENIHFLLIGNGSLRQVSESKIGQYKEVTFIGEVPYTNIQYYLAICNILVSPHCPQIDGKEFFGSPTKLFEYMAMGKGIVASKLGQIGKILENEKTAILVKPGDVDELINEILRLASDKTLRERLGRKAREEVVKNYTWKRNTQKLIERLNLL